MTKLIIIILLLPSMTIASQEPRKKYTKEQLYALNPIKHRKPKERYLKVPNNSPELTPTQMPPDIDSIILTLKDQ